MATEQVLQWINNDLSLSQSVANFETDFSNGYLIGEILNQYGQSDLLHFSKKKNKEAKVNNFYLVENSLRKLNVRFDGKLIHQIMEEERGASLRLLYQIKLACQKLNVPRDDPDEASMTGLKNAKMHTILANKREATMEMTRTIPPPTVGGKDIRTSKQVRADNRTLGYDVAQKTLFDNALKSHQAEMDLIKSITQGQREANIHKLTENQTFMKDWIQEGKQNWRINQAKRAEGIEKVKYFEDREVNIYKQRLENELLNATAEQINGVSDFEKNLQKLGIQQGISMDEAIKKQEEKKGIPPGQIQNFSYAATMNKIKETKKNSDFAGKERDRRRRKMIVDQQNAQTKLDKEASEEALISKLLAQTSEEQRDAFIDERMGKCKHNDFLMRQSVALTIEEKRRQQNESAEVKRKGTLKDVEAERARKNDVRRQKAKKAALEKKMEKRVVNIEIASGLVDLLLDLADETFEVVCSNEEHQIPNPEWRQFINIFKAGKKVSLRNVVQAPAASDESANRTSLSIPKDSQAHDIQKQFWSDPSMLCFYEFLSGSGAFNIPQLRPDMWHQYQDQYQALSDQFEGVPFVDCKMQENGELIQIIDALYKQALHPSATDDLQVEGNALLSQPTIKLAMIGRAFSGKKTIANAMKEVLGNDVAIFNLDDIIREAIEYISPTKQDESVHIDPKAKGKKAVKDEPVNVDIFEGKNSAQYKSLAQQIKDQYFQGETIPKIDLAEFVLDDQLLNGLVIERLKMQTEGKAPMGEEQIKAGVAREQELVKQLEEMEQAAAAIAADPKAKAPKPAKGAATPEQVKAELEEIRSFKASGWILLGYPLQLSQLKLLEHEMTGFSAKIDQSKSERTEIRESWRKLTLDDKDSTEASLPSNQTVASGFDSIFFIETPETECVRRVEGAESEAGNEQRIKTINENFDSKVGSIKKWCEQFGLVDEDGTCRVTLNQEVCATEWDQKEVVQEAAIVSLKKVMAFKQAQFNTQRQNFMDMLAQQNSVEAAGDQPATPSKSVKHDDAQLASPAESVIMADDQSANFAAEDTEHKMQATIETKSNLDTVTNRSSRRTKQLNQQRYEINDKQKIDRWENMLNDYYKNSVQRFNDLVKQRKRIFGLFQKTQSNFLSFICRDAPYQRRVIEFCENYNRFSEQYPELQGKEETRVELLKRVSMLNDQLWQTVLERKSQAVEEQENQHQLMLQGWESREKSRLVTFIAQLMEYEFERFMTVVQIVSGWVINQDIDMKSLCGKLDERNTSTFNLSDNGYAESPMLDQVVSYLHNCIAQLIQEPCVKQLPSNLQSLIYKERTNFHLRTNTLKQYALLLLIEVNENTEEISSAFEDWIITSVKKENSVASNVIKQVKSLVEADAGYLDTIKVHNPDLESSIRRVQLEEGQPKYLLQGTQETPRGMAETRMDILTLSLMYKQFKSNAYEELLDSQTFLSLIIGNYQSYTVPQRWRNLPFQSMLDLVSKFAASPLTNDGESGKNLFGSSGERVQFVNWKKMFALMALASSSIPSDEKLQTYGSELAYYGSSISLENFKNADAWFDSSESANTASQMLKASSQFSSQDQTQEDEIFDQERLFELKELLWKTVKRTNEEGIRAQDLVQIVSELKGLCQGGEQCFGDLL